MRVRVTVLVAILASTATSSANTSTPFPAGTLIIPPGAAYQDDCGAVSAYGLIYDVLRANAWLDTQPGLAHVTFYYAYLDTKASPNRCKPTSADIPPSTPADPSWNDGCDFQVSDGAGTPVTLINNANHLTPDGPVVTFNTTAKTNVYPGYISRTIGAGMTAGYLGGPFLILPSDVPEFTQLLDGTLLAKDAAGNTIDFTAFRTRTGSQSIPPNSTCTLGTDHYVNVHRAAAVFTANAGLAFTSPPPRLALLATDTTNATGTINDNILQGYLQNAGLTFVGANGTATGTTGQIYDTFDFMDIVNGKLTAPKYSMLWAPHWESNATGSAPTGNDATALAKISTFLDGQTGLAAECAAISTLEGSYVDRADNTAATAKADGNYRGLQLQTCVNNGAGACAAGLTNWGIGRNGFDLAAGGGPEASGPNALKNCSDITMASGSQCAFYSYPGDPFAQVADFVWSTSPAYNVATVGGITPDSWVWGFTPLADTSSIYKPGVKPLVSGVTSLVKADLTTPTTARAMIFSDYATRNIKDNTPGKANILYLGGHAQDASVAATKLMLETLLQLGISTLPPLTTTTEVSRNSPIVATIGIAPVVVQGTFEEVSPAPTATTFTVATDATAFRFPFVKGHLRARTATTITTTASTFGSTGVIFDAATGIPPATYSGGCSSWYTATCRTVFTTLAAGANPALHYLQSSELATIGPLMGPAVIPNPALSSANQAILIQRVLAGDDSAVPGVFQSKLGGVDRSTVAVIGSSALVNGTRQTIAYFGGDDGMMHAVCASTGGACDILGRELWAYLPRTLLPVERYNTGRVDGSPRVMDMFGDFTASGSKSWRTILTFQTGTGDTTTQARVPAVYALDISDPVNPKVIWEYSLANIAVRGVFELGVGLTMSGGQVQSLAKNVAFAQTNNAGTGGTGSVVTAIDVETGTALWQTGYAYPAPRVVGHPVVPSTGIPGGAIVVDKAGNGFVTDLVYATLYGDLWEVDPATGISRYGAGKPELRFSADYHPIGAQPAIYSKGGVQFAAIADGGYADPFDTNWTVAGTAHYAFGVSLSAPVADAIFDENKGAPDIGFKFAFGGGEAGFAQALIVGGQLFVTSDTTDVNSATYGSGGATGHVYRMDLGTNALGTTVVVEGGASSIANSGTTLYSGASDQTAQLGTSATSLVGTSVDASLTAKVVRILWLRSM